MDEIIVVLAGLIFLWVATAPKKPKKKDDKKYGEKDGKKDDGKDGKGH